MIKVVHKAYATIPLTSFLTKQLPSNGARLTIGDNKNKVEKYFLQSFNKYKNEIKNKIEKN